MSGISEFNFPAFFHAAKKLGDEGHDVVNPAALDAGDDLPETHYGANGQRAWEVSTNQRQRYLKRDVKSLVECDAVAVLLGWRESKGAAFEVSVAIRLGMPVLDAYTLEPEYERPAIEAMRIVHSKQRGYPHPTDDFTKIGTIWSGIVNYSFDPMDVALMMAGLKLARESSHHKRDNLVDMIGYVETLELIHRYEASLVFPGS